MSILQYAIETFVDIDGNIFLLGNDPDFLEQKGQTILQYTQTIAPSTPVGDVYVGSFDSTEFLREIDSKTLFPQELSRYQVYELEQKEAERSSDERIQKRMRENFHDYYSDASKILNKKYTYYLDLSSILPTSVKTTIDLSHRYRGARGFGSRSINCHSGAYIASGTFSKQDYMAQPSSKTPGLEALSFEQLSTGDIVSLTADHSIVFLDHDICISANGCASSLKIHRIDDVLSVYYKNPIYNTIRDLARISEALFRKNPDIYYPELMLNLIKQKTMMELDQESYIRSDTIESSKEQIIKQLFIQCYLTDYKNIILTTMYNELFKARCGIRTGGMQLMKTALDENRISIEEGLTILEQPDPWNRLKSEDSHTPTDWIKFLCDHITSQAIPLSAVAFTSVLLCFSTGPAPVMLGSSLCLVALGWMSQSIFSSNDRQTDENTTRSLSTRFS